MHGFVRRQPEQKVINSFRYGFFLKQIKHNIVEFLIVVKFESGQLTLW